MTFTGELPVKTPLHPGRIGVIHLLFAQRTAAESWALTLLCFSSWFNNIPSINSELPNAREPMLLVFMSI